MWREFCGVMGTALLVTGIALYVYWCLAGAFDKLHIAVILLLLSLLLLHEARICALEEKLHQNDYGTRANRPAQSHEPLIYTCFKCGKPLGGERVCFSTEWDAWCHVKCCPLTATNIIDEECGHCLPSFSDKAFRQNLPSMLKSISLTLARLWAEIRNLREKIETLEKRG